jgi:FkbM family methyltransferase
VKSQIRAVLQKIVGFDTYLVLHALFVYATLRFRPGEGAVRHFVDRLPSDATVLDIGANVGHMTLLFSRRVRRGRVVAFEPIPENADAARRLLRLARARNVRLHAIGLGERDAELEMCMPTDARGGRLGGVSYIVDAAHRPAAAGVTYTVPVRRLDTLPGMPARVDAIKIDVEDHERYVFRGAARIIARDLPLIYAELFSAENKDECFAFLGGLGYTAFVAEGANLVRHDRARRGSVNYLFVPPVRGSNSAPTPGSAADGGTSWTEVLRGRARHVLSGHHGAIAVYGARTALRGARGVQRPRRRDP